MKNPNPKNPEIKIERELFRFNGRVYYGRYTLFYNKKPVFQAWIDYKFEGLLKVIKRFEEDFKLIVSVEDYESSLVIKDLKSLKELSLISRNVSTPQHLQRIRGEVLGKSNRAF